MDIKRRFPQGRGHPFGKTLRAELHRRNVHRETQRVKSRRMPCGRLPTRLFEYPLADRDDEPRFFGQRNEVVRANETDVRSIPTQQGFDTCHRAAA